MLHPILLFPYFLGKLYVQRLKKPLHQRVRTKFQESQLAGFLLYLISEK